MPFTTSDLVLRYLISAVVRSQRQAMQISMFYVMPSLFLSGFMFPLQGPPGRAQVFGEVIPITRFLRVICRSLLGKRKPS